MLALVILYAEGRFPNDVVFPTVMFVIKHLGTPKENCTFIVTMEELRARTGKQPSAVVGRTIFDLLLKKLWEINSFDGLHTFFTDINIYLANGDTQSKTIYSREPGKSTVLGRTSILGCFVRRASLEYTRLQFNDGVALWRSFVQFREPSLSTWRRRNIGAGPTSFDVNLKGLSMADPLVAKVYGGVKAAAHCQQ